MNTHFTGRQRYLAAILPLFLCPAAAGATGGFAWFSCEDHPRPLAIAGAILELAPDVVITQGDTPYTNHATSAWGIIAAPVQFDSLAAGPNPRDFNHHYEQMMLTPGWPELVAGPFSLYSQFDDHEWGGDNWAHNLITANMQVPTNATTQAQVNYHWRQGRIAWQAWADAYSDNAQATYDVYENTVIPSGALAENETPSPSDYPITYFRQTHGDIEYIFIDDISYRDYSDAALRNTPVTLLGAQQKAWLIDRINASTAKFVVVSSTKTLGASGPGDSWRFYPIERNEILDALTRTGVLWISGDYHYPSVIRQNDGATSKWTNINPGPAGVVWSDHGPANDNTGTLIWASTPYLDSTGWTRIPMFGYGYLQDDRLHVEIRSADQTVYYHGYLAMDSNEITTVSGLPSLPLAGDDDNDGIANDTDNCRTVANGPFALDPADYGISQRNSDGDAEGDACDADDDNDTIPDSDDNCRTVANSPYAPDPADNGISQRNSDGDAEGDACDADDDNDTIPDSDDNCRLVANTDQRDTDTDGYGNICDADLNNSGGLVNVLDFAAFRSVYLQPRPLTAAAANADFNGDGSVNLLDFITFRNLYGKPPGP